MIFIKKITVFLLIRSSKVNILFFTIKSFFIKSKISLICSY